ncbi:hypothetical protein NESM_000392900 [Novymonas esmeraldas]|uniref:Calponin-homology (CH) domain-containing protein n=1 Tax=Novymonas esmeraldas TaxID=1808958 RepID=A0AAW0EM50_9TRYP
MATTSTRGWDALRSAAAADVVLPTARTSTSAPSHTERPPTMEEIATFMQRFAARLPLVMYPDHPPQADGAAAAGSTAATSVDVQRLCVSVRVAPYLYTGADYALVLAACLPYRGIDLSLLNWSAHPLLSQRVGNLRVFCQAARSLAMPDTPLSALHPELLQSSAACVVAHLKVQHWLYSLSLRCAPSSHHDAAAVRAVCRHLQLGEPYLKRGRDVRDTGDTCASVRECPPLPAEHLLLRCAPALAPLPAFTGTPDTAPPCAAAAEGTGAHGSTGTHACGATSACHSTGVAAEAAGKPKPWLNYSKPWLLPSLRAAEAKRAASEAAAARQAQEERERDPRFTAFVAQSTSLYDQHRVTSTAAAERRDQLRAVKAQLLQDIVEGRPIDFKDYAAQLRGV